MFRRIFLFFVFPYALGFASDQVDFEEVYELLRRFEHAALTIRTQPPEQDYLQIWIDAADPNTDTIPQYRVGQIIDGWTFESFVHQSNFSEVWKVSRVVGGEKQSGIIKISLNQVTNWAIINEWEILQKLNQTDARVLDHSRGGLDDPSYLVFRPIEGRNLDEFLDHHKRLSPLIIYSLFESIAKKLAFVHSRGIAHRDFHHGNVVCTTATNAEIIDFGLAFDVNEPREEENPLHDRGYIVGPADHRLCAPEQLRGEISRSSDVYALGFMLTDAMLSSVREELLSQPVCQAMLKVGSTALEDHKTRRYPTAEEFLIALRRAVPVQWRE